jgi:hypothetical protein
VLGATSQPCGLVCRPADGRDSDSDIDININSHYLQAGFRRPTTVIPSTGAHGRRGAPQFRGVAAVHEMILDVFVRWLTPELQRIRSNGIGPLHPEWPDCDTFVLTAILLSAAVRFSGCL